MYPNTLMNEGMMKTITVGEQVCWFTFCLLLAKVQAMSDYLKNT